MRISRCAQLIWAWRYRTYVNEQSEADQGVLYPRLAELIVLHSQLLMPIELSIVRILSLVLFVMMTKSASAETDLREKVEQLSAHSKNLIGVSIYAAAELLRMKEMPVFIRRERLVETGEIQKFTELEREGYIRVEVVKGLPGGSSSDEEFLWVIRTDAGEHLQYCFDEAVQTNKLKATPESDAPYPGGYSSMRDLSYEPN